MWKQLYCIALLGTGHFQGASNQLAGDGESLTAAVTAKWDAILSSSNTMEYEVRTELRSRTEGAEWTMTATEWMRIVLDKKRGMTRWFDYDSKSTKPSQAKRPLTVNLINNLYRSTIVKEKKEGATWMVNELEKGEALVANQVGEVFYCPWMLLGGARSDLLLKSSTFKMTRVERLPDGPAGRCVRGHFLHEGVIPYQRPIISGNIDFEVEQAYRPTNFEFRILSDSEDGICNGTLEYGASENGIPVLKEIRSESQTRLPTKKNIVVFGSNKTTISGWKYDTAVASDEFRLTHYGLPEPADLARPGRYSAYVWFFAVAVFCGVVVVALRWLQRRRAGAA
jgi:hypothetical protein